MKAFTTVAHIEELDAESKYLVHKAKEAASHAYAPYSKFLVGAALLLDDGTYITGTNQENAAYPSGMCAERVAIFAASSLHPERKIMKIAVVAKRKNGKELLPATPCGGCRQVLLEAEQKQHQHFPVVMQHTDHSWVVAPSAESLLPYSFSHVHLEKEDKK